MHRTRTPARGADSLVATNKQYAEYAAANLYDKREHWAQRADKNGDSRARLGSRGRGRSECFVSINSFKTLSKLTREVLLLSSPFYGQEN